jgi:hypothetical protein
MWKPNDVTLSPYYEVETEEDTNWQSEETTDKMWSLGMVKDIGCS